MWNQVDAAIAEIQERYPPLETDPIQVWVSRTEECLHYGDAVSEPGLYINKIHVLPEHRGQGHATRALWSITEVADWHHVSLFVWPTSLTWVCMPPLSLLTIFTSRLGLSQRQLERFYCKAGFRYHCNGHWVRRPR